MNKTITICSLILGVFCLGCLKESTTAPTADRFTISIAENEKGIVDPHGDFTVQRADSINIKAKNSRDGYRFLKWQITNGSNNISVRDTAGDSTYVADIAGDAEIEAVFTINYYDIILNSDDSGDIILPAGDTISVKYMGERSIKAVPKTGFTFFRWVIVGDDQDVLIEDLTADSTILYNVTGEATIRAEFTRKLHRLVVGSSDSGSIQVQPEPNADGYYPYQTEVQLTAIPANGCDFNRWYGASVSSNPTTIVTILEDDSIWASFSKEDYRIHVSVEENGEISTGGGDNLVPYKDSLTIAAEPDYGYVFSEWLVENGPLGIKNRLASETKVVDVRNDGIVKATFVKNHFTVTVIQPDQDYGHISITPLTDDSKYEYMSEITVKANPSLGWQFGNWKGHFDGNDATFTFRVEKDTTIEVEFIPVTFGENVICVRAGAQDGGNGRSWASPYNDLTTALVDPILSDTIPNDTIWVAEGVYSPRDADTARFIVSSPAAIYGGFKGHEKAIEERDWINNKTILHGGNLNETILAVSEGASNTIIDGFVVEGAGKWGFYLEDSSTIRNCIFRHNNINTVPGGSAVFAKNDKIEITTCIFHDNSGIFGSAVLVGNDVSNILIANCVVAENRGNAIFLGGASVNIIKSTIVKNTAAGSSVPGGIYNRSNNLFLESTILWGNGNSDSLITQINETGYVDYCCIMDADIEGKGIGTIGDLWQETNISSSAEFQNDAIPTNSEEWFDFTGNNIAPFIPGADSECANKSRVTNDSYKEDIRGISRYKPYDIGAYERK